MPVAISAVTQSVWTLPYFTNIPTDVVTNVMHWIYLPSNPTTTNYAQLAVVIDDFYDDVYGAVNMGNWCVPANASVTFYDLQQPTPRVPVHTASVAVTTTPVAGNAPLELAICLSFYGAPVPGVNRASQRGRIFIGGMADPLTAGSASTFPNLGATARNALATACDTMQASALAVGWQWVVWSPTRAAQNMDDAFDVVGGWVDNEADTQRRRGVETTVRSVWTV